MSAANTERILRYIRQLAGERELPLPDAELLRRYLATRDESAFAALVRRHGPMVFAVCRSVLRQRDDAEDAFQAVFLILARKAGSIRRPESLSSFLHGVAYRVALKARAENKRRQDREAKAPLPATAATTEADLSWGEVRSILHAELAALPERWRVPLVLCYLEGLTQEEAGQRLGWTATAVKGRLQRGREKLRRRLERRGVALTAALAAALTGQVLAETAVRTAPPFTVATATSAAAALASGFLRSWLPLKLAMLSAVLLSVGLVAGGMVMRSPKPRSEKASPLSAEKPAAEPPVPRPAVDAHGDPLPPGASARLGTVRFNHGQGLSYLFFSPDGKTIISEGDGGICFWDVASGKELGRRRTPKTYFEFQPILLADDKTLMSLHEASDGDLVTVWDLATKKEIRTKKLPVRRTTFSGDHWDSLSPDGKLCVAHVHTPAQVQVLDVATGKKLYQLAKGAKTFVAVAFASNDRIVSADEKNRIEVWEARTGKLVRDFTHDAPIRFLLASPDGRWLATLEQRPSPYGRRLEQDEVVNIWDLTTGTRKQSLHAKAKYRFTIIRFSPDGKSLLTSCRSVHDGDEVILWDYKTGQRLHTFDGASGINADVAAISPDGGSLAAGGYGASKFDLWDLKTGLRLSSKDNRVATGWGMVLLSPNGERASVTRAASISSWDATTGRLLRSIDLPRNRFYYYHFSPDGRYAVDFRGEGEELRIVIWDVVARKRLHSLRVPGPYRQYQRVASAFTPDSTLLATWRPDKKQTPIHIWDVRSGELLRSFEENKAGWRGEMHFTADGKTLFVAGRYVTAYEVSSGKELFSWRGKPHTPGRGNSAAIGGKPESEDERIGWGSLTVSPDGTLVAATPEPPEPDNVGRGREEGSIVFHEARTGKLLHRCEESTTNQRLTFSSDGQILASSKGEIVHLWEVVTGKAIATFKGHEGQIIYLSFSGDGRRLASASSDSTVLIWDATGQTNAAMTDAALEESWKALLGDDAASAHRAVWTLARTPGKSVSLLKDQLRPVKAVGREQLDRLIGDLDSDQLSVRAKAMAELQKLDESAAPALRRKLQGKPTLEQRRQIEPLLNKLDAAIPSGEALRSLRAVRVLEHAGTPEALWLLRELAAGAEGARLTREAAAALTRLSRRSP